MRGWRGAAFELDDRRPAGAEMMQQGVMMEHSDEAMVALEELWRQEERVPMQGWDFSRLEGRCIEDPLPWDFRELVRRRLTPTSRWLDLGTGGGEFMLSLDHPLELISVTEAYPPNLQLCRERLEPLGVTVREVKDDLRLDFPDAAFDVVSSRHEDYDPAEVRRVLRLGGVFLTQQVGARNDLEFARRIDPGFQVQYSHVELEPMVAGLVDAGMRIDFRAEHFGAMRFTDTAAFVYFAKAVPWEFPGFSVDRDIVALREIEREIRGRGYIEGRQHRLAITAVRVESAEVTSR